MDQHRPTVSLQADKKLLRVVPLSDEGEWKKNPSAYVGITVDAGTTRVLQVGDTVVLSKSAPAVKLLWIPLNVYYHFKIKEDELQRKAREAGDMLVYMRRGKGPFDPLATHFAVAQPKVSVLLLQALISAVPVVRPDYVEEILRRGSLEPDDPEAYERELRLPLSEEFLPEVFHAEGMDRAELTKCILPSVKRTRLLKGTTLLFVLDGEDEVKMANDVEGLAQQTGAITDRIVSSDARLQEDGEALRFLRQKKTEAQSYLATCGEEASEAPDEGLVVIVAPQNADARLPWFQRLAKYSRTLSIAMPEEGLVAVSKSLMHSDSRRFLNIQAAPLPIDTASRVPEGIESNNVEGQPAAPPSPRQQQQQQESVDGAMRNGEEPPASNASVTMEEPIPSASVIGPTPTASKPRRRRAAGAADNDPLASLFGTASSTNAQKRSAEDAKASGAVSQQLWDSEEAPRPTPPTPRAPSRLKRAATGNKPRQSEEFRNIFGVSSESGAGRQNSSLSFDNPNESTQERFSKRFRLELDEQDRLSESQARGENASSAAALKEAVPSKRRLDDEHEAGTGEDMRQPKRANIDHRSEEEASPHTETDPGGQEPPRRVNAKLTSPPQIVREADLPQSSSTVKEDGPAQDSRFLLAMATNRKTKRPMDQFDKEFNQLRIARPPGAGIVKSNNKSSQSMHSSDSKARAAPRSITAPGSGHCYVDADEVDDPGYKTWQQMEADDFDVHAAGNFVQVDFVPLIRKDATGVAQRSGADMSRSLANSEGSRVSEGTQFRAEWQGRSNFKKFKVKERPVKMPIALDLEETADFGTGERYIKGRGNNADRHSVDHMSEETSDIAEVVSATAKRGAHKQKRTVLAESSDEEDNLRPSMSVDSRKRAARSR